MRINGRMVIVAAGAFLLGAVANSTTSSHGQVPAAKPAVIWEYKAMAGPGRGDPTQALDRMGKVLGPQGWELATVVTEGDGKASFIFKRPTP